QWADTYTINGWTIDPDSTGAVSVNVLVDGEYVATVTANKSRPDVGSAYPGWGNYHGFTSTGILPDGIHNVCAVAVNVGQGNNTLLGCKAAWISISPFGSYDGNQL